MTLCEDRSCNYLGPERRSTGGKCSWCELWFSPKGRNGPLAVLRLTILRRAVRLNEAVNRCKVEIWSNSKAVPDLEGTAVVVPVRDQTDGQLP